MANRHFQEASDIVLRCMEETLSELLGSNCWSAIKYQIEKDYGRDNGQIVQRAEIFEDTVHHLFGAGAHIMIIFHDESDLRKTICSNVARGSNHNDLNVLFVSMEEAAQYKQFLSHDN